MEEPRVEIVTRVLPVVRSQEEKADLADQLADALADKAKYVDAAREAKKTFKKRIKACDQEVAGLHEDMALRFVDGEVKIECTWDFQLNTYLEKRLDTGEIIEHRAMTSQERQGELDLDKKEGAA